MNHNCIGDVGDGVRAHECCLIIITRQMLKHCGVSLIYDSRHDSLYRVDGLACLRMDA